MNGKIFAFFSYTPRTFPTGIVRGCLYILFYILSNTNTS